jgi:hypothetical protein
MAKRKPSHKDEKRRRRQAMERLRKETGHTPRSLNPPFELDLSTAEPDQLEDIRAAFEPGTIVSPASMTELALDSYDLYAQPELQGITANPIVAVLVYTRVAAEMDMVRGQISEDDNNLVIRNVTPLLLRVDPDLKTTLISALFDLRSRLRERGRRFDAGRAALVQLLIENGDAQAWRKIGLLHYITLRSVEEGFRLVQERTSESGTLEEMLMDLATEESEEEE